MSSMGSPSIASAHRLANSSVDAVVCDLPFGKQCLVKKILFFGKAR